MISPRRIDRAGASRHGESKEISHNSSPRRV